MEANEHEERVVRKKLEAAVSSCPCRCRGVGSEDDRQRDDDDQWIDACLGPQTDTSMKIEPKESCQHDCDHLHRRDQKNYGRRHCDKNQDHPLGPKTRESEHDGCPQEQTSL